MSGDEQEHVCDSDIEDHILNGLRLSVDTISLMNAVSQCASVLPQFGDEEPVFEVLGDEVYENLWLAQVHMKTVITALTAAMNANDHALNGEPNG